ncbi:MAG: RNA polymerase sigma factor [Anaerolineae bacterium]
MVIQPVRQTAIVSDELYEQALLHDAQGGDIDAYETLQRALEPDIRRFVQSKIYDAYVVDDITQEIFLAFYQNMHRIDPVENLRPYLFRIARNKCYDDLRRVQRNQHDSLDEEPIHLRVSFTEASHQPKPDDLTHWMLLHMEVQEAINRLPETQRETLVLYSEYQLTYAEIADRMDCSIGTVKSRLYYAKKNLRGLMNPDTLAVIDDEFAPSGPARKPNTNHKQDTVIDGDEVHHEPL